MRGHSLVIQGWKDSILKKTIRESDQVNGSLVQLLDLTMRMDRKSDAIYTNGMPILPGKSAR